MTPATYDAVVIGFGPVGAVAACLLGQAGLRTLVIDRSTEVWAKPRAIAIDHEIMRILQNLGVADQVLPHTAPFTASEHFGAKGQLIRRVDMVPEPYPLGYVPSMVFTQPPVEAALRAHAASYPGVDIRLGCTFQTLEQDPAGVTLTIQDADAPSGSSPETIRAAWVIASDGASSSVRQHLGIPFEDLVFDEPWMVIDVKVAPSGLAKLPHTAAQFCEPERPSTFIVGPGNHRRWEIMLLPDEDPRDMERPERVWALLSRWLAPDDGELWRASSYRFHALVAAQWRQGRVFLAGDAAHQQPPFIGQGMCQGIRDAANLVWKLAAVHHNEAADTLLDTYAEERGRHVRTLTGRIKAIGHAICERDPAAAQARDEALLASNGGHPPTVTRQDIVPPLEQGFLAPGQAPGQGTLFPQPWLTTRHGPARMDVSAGFGWRLVLDGPSSPLPGREGPGEGDVAAQSVLARSGPIPTTLTIGPDHTPERDGVVATWFARHNCIGAIVRPDHYVYGVLHDLDEAAPMIEALQQRLAGATS